MARRVITLDIDSTSVRLVEAQGDKVVRWASRPLQPRGESTSGERDEAPGVEALAAAVKELIPSSGTKVRDVIASVSGLYSMSRVVMVPGTPGTAATREAVLDAAREVMTISEEEQYLSWEEVSAFEAGRQMLIVGLPRDVVDGEIQALRTAGVRLRTLDLKAMALVRAVNQRQALILNIEESSFDTVVVAGGTTEVMRTTAWEQSRLPVADQAEHLAIALDLAAGFYDSRHPNSPLDAATPLYITGPTSADTALVEGIRARVPYPVTPLAPPLECPSDMPVSQYAANIGLALKEGMSRNPGLGEYSLPNMNLLPQTYRPWRPSRRQMLLFSAAALALAMIVPLNQASSDATRETASLKKQYDAINTLLQQRQAELKAREPMDKAIAEYRTIVAMGGGFSEDLQVVQSEAERLGIHVKSAIHTGDSIAVISQADSYTTFREYITALEKSGRFSSVTPPAESYPYKEGGTITLKPKAAK